MRSLYVKRNLESSLLKASEQFPAVALTGSRQSGKTTLLKHIFHNTHKYFTFDDYELRESAQKDPKGFIEEAGDAVILDEIQYVPKLLSYLKMNIDKNRRRKGRYVLTGSQQFNLIKGLGDTLAGRIAIFDLLPFSMSEVSILFKNAKTFDVIYEKCCLRGMYPEIVIDKKINKDMWFKSYIQTYLERDIRGIYSIGNLVGFQRLLSLLSSRCGQILNYSSLSVELGIAVNTVKSWISILEASKIIYLLQPYYKNLGKRVTKSPKIYFLDTGLLCYLLKINEKKLLMKGPFAGHIFENFCLQEIIKFFANQGTISPAIYYLRTKAQLEVDLIIETSNGVIPLELKLSKTPKLSMAANIQKFKQIFAKLRIQKGAVVTMSSDENTFLSGTEVISCEKLHAWLARKFILKK